MSDWAWTTVQKSELLMTAGRVLETDAGLRVEEPEVRAVLTPATARAGAAMLRYTYRGPVAGPVPSDSGPPLFQIGLKLLAANGCNVLYVMRTVGAKPALVVKAKRNPGQDRSDDCGAEGYTTVARRPLPELAVGGTETFAARLEPAAGGASVLTVSVDGSTSLAVRVEAALLAGLDGPPGFRTDNGVYDFIFRTGKRRGYIF